MTENVRKHPVLFIGHGSPMNILANNLFTHDLTRLRDQLLEPDAILVISAHWLTRGTHITTGEHPEQMYDFHGFPGNLYKHKYQAPGSPEIAKIVAETVGDNIILSDPTRGIDHAGWSVLQHIYPEQKIPVLELSLDIEKEPVYHFELGQKLAKLRNKNILVIGSGNIIHNLRETDFHDAAPPFGWASEFDSIIKNALVTKDFANLINYHNLGPSTTRAIPFNDHYLPMLYILGMVEEDETIWFIH
ncbi:MAG: 4,5-DOPA dioxygenase extradiol, partial [Bacteroidetes bacterium]